MFAGCFSKKSASFRTTGGKRSILWSGSDSEVSLTKSDEKGFRRTSYESYRGSFDWGRVSMDTHRSSTDPGKSPNMRFSPSNKGDKKQPQFFHVKDGARPLETEGRFRKRKSEMGVSEKKKDERGFLDRAFESAANIDELE